MMVCCMFLLAPTAALHMATVITKVDLSGWFAELAVKPSEIVEVSQMLLDYYDFANKV